MIDRKKLNENFQYFDNETIVEIIDIFFSEYEERFSNLQNNILARDFAKLQFNAHSLKGVIANFHDPVTIDLSRRLDEMAKKKEEAGLDQLFEQLKKSAGELSEELKQLRQEFTS